MAVYHCWTFRWWLYHYPTASKTPIYRRIKLLRERSEEFFLALELSKKKYSKEQILTMYLTTLILMCVWGVEMRVNTGFHQSESGSSCDALAGMLKGRNCIIRPDSVEDSTNRRDTVFCRIWLQRDILIKTKTEAASWYDRCTISMKEKSQITVTPLILMRWLMTVSSII